MSPRRLFTVDEANALVPRLSLLLGRLQQAALRLHAERAEVARLLGVEPESLTTPDLLRHRPAVGAVVEELDALVREIEESGAELKDIRLGLIDFAARRDGADVLLCWQYGEPEVAFWHAVGDGFAGRRPLGGPARAPILQ